MEKIIDLKAKKAEKLIAEGMDLFSKGDVDEAAKRFEKSAELSPSAEAYTYWGWMLSFEGKLTEAIELCKQAISIDSEFGNPYNDIGTYYMKQGLLDEAVPWLEAAKNAKRYHSKHFPFLNLGRIYLSKGAFMKALKEFEGALVYDGENAELHAVSTRIRSNAHCY